MSGAFEEAVRLARQQWRDDADTIGELAARVNTLDGEIAELRDELHEVSRRENQLRSSFHAFRENQLRSSFHAFAWPNAFSRKV